MLSLNGDIVVVRAFPSLLDTNNIRLLMEAVSSAKRADAGCGNLKERGGGDKVVSSWTLN
jgi:hypothetical protein